MCEVDVKINYGGGWCAIEVEESQCCCKYSELLLFVMLKGGMLVGLGALFVLEWVLVI